MNRFEQYMSIIQEMMDETEKFEITEVTFSQIGKYEEIKKIVCNTFPGKKAEDFVEETQKGDLLHNKNFSIFKIKNSHQAREDRDNESFYIVYDKINKKLYYDFIDSGEDAEVITNVLKEAKIDISDELIKLIKNLDAFTSSTYQ